ncbi:MAG: DUF2252 domain-containing protein [Candidatus Obscuribacterales bacterium]|nr:DUF2252 domain-containing protein [Candidatus Obscuribacterales bacterium]
MSKRDHDQVISLYHDWETFLEPAQPLSERIANGKKRRTEASRASQGKWKPPGHRKDPVDLLLSQHEGRLEKLLPHRYSRMSASPLAFLRGSALVMTSDLAHTPSSGIPVQLCGDCHLSNFGIFATPERNIIFDLNDFDETHPGPWEWDLKRLAVSFAVAALDNGSSIATAESAVEALAKSYRTNIEQFSRMATLEVWYHRIDVELMIKQLEKAGRRDAALTKLKQWKRTRTHEGAFAKLTEVVDGKRIIKENPPFIVHPEELTRHQMHEVLLKYLRTLPDYRRQLLLRYRFVDMAMKVVGIGSVGTKCGVVLLQGEGAGEDPLFLQIKQANPSVLEPFTGRSQYSHHGERVVAGQRLLQAASDLFLGWTTGPKGFHFYVRQLMDVKGSIPVDELDAVTLTQYAQLCGKALARAHARSGDAGAIQGYLGTSDAFDEALCKFATAYSKQNEADYEALLRAIRQKRIPIAAEPPTKNPRPQNV